MARSAEQAERAAAAGGGAFEIVSAFEPAGDQPEAIRQLIEGLRAGERDQVLLGVTGSGKTFTMTHVIRALGRPTLILAPNKTLAAQLYGEMKEFLPNNAVEYFVSYYDYYQPEAYVPRSDTYIEKDASINEHIDRMRHSATRALLEREDVVIVASVSCIYGIGDGRKLFGDDDIPGDWRAWSTDQRGHHAQASSSCSTRRNDTRPSSVAAFRVRGDVPRDLSQPHSEDGAWRISLFGDEIEEHRGVRSPSPVSRTDRLEMQQIRRLSQQSLHHVPQARPCTRRPRQIQRGTR